MNDFEYECNYVTQVAIANYSSFAEYEKKHHLWRFKHPHQIDELRRIWSTWYRPKK